MLSVPPRLHSFDCPSQDGCCRFFPGFVRLATVFELGHRFGIFVALQLEWSHDVCTVAVQVDN